MAIDYAGKAPVNLQEAVRDLHARLTSLNTQVNPPKPPTPPAPPKP